MRPDRVFIKYLRACMRRSEPAAHSERRQMMMFTLTLQLSCQSGQQLARAATP